MNKSPTAMCRGREYTFESHRNTTMSAAILCVDGGVSDVHRITKPARVAEVSNTSRAGRLVSR